MEEDKKSLEPRTPAPAQDKLDGHYILNSDSDGCSTPHQPVLKEKCTKDMDTGKIINNELDLQTKPSDNIKQTANVISKDEPEKSVANLITESDDTIQVSLSTKVYNRAPLLTKESPAEPMTDGNTQDSLTTTHKGNGDSQPVNSDRLVTNEEVTITIDVGGGGDKGPLAGAYFNPSDSVRFQRMVLEVVEELRMRRAMDNENEDRIRQLMHEKHDLDTQYHDATSKISNLEKMILEKVGQTRRESLSTIQDLADAKAKLLSSYESSEKDVKSLKDEIRALQLNNYTLEKKVREQDRKSEMAASPSDSHLTQIPALEMKCAAVVKKTEDLASACTKLDKNVKEACRLNTRLVYANEHKNCEVDRYRAEVSRLATELREARTESSYEPEKLKHKINLLETQVAALRKQVETENGISKSLRKLLAHSRSEKKLLGERLSEAHSVIAQQTEQASHGAEEFDKLKQRFYTLEGKNNDLHEKYALLELSTNEARAKLTKEFDELKKEAEHGQEELESLRTTHHNLLKNHDELQQLNSTWAKKNVELSEQVCRLKAELEKPKCEAGVQVGTECLEAESQTEPSVSSRCVQTVSSCLQTVDGEAQTLYQATVCSTSQTDHVLLVCSDTQTLDLECEDKCIQTTQDEPSDIKITSTAGNSTNILEEIRQKNISVKIKANTPVRIATPPSTPVKSSQEQKEHNSLPAKSALQEKRLPEKHNRLKLRPTEEPVMGSNGLLQQQLSEADRAANAGTGRFSFQFLHIPELERCPTSTPDGDTLIAPTAVVGAAPSVSCSGHIVEQVREQVSSGKRPAPSSDPTVPGILSDPRASKPKRPKKVHFATSAGEVSVLCANLSSSKPSEDEVLLIGDDNSDSEELFSEDEPNEDIELRPSQVSRIETVLSE